LFEKDPEFQKFPEPPPPEAEFKHAIGVGNRCFYYAQAFTKDGPDLHERGVGLVAKVGEDFFLQRDLPIVWGESPEEALPFQAGSPPIRFNGSDFIRVQTLTPPTYVEALTFPYSVIACAHPFTPMPVEIEENSLLGRIGDIIQSVDMEELREMFKVDELALNSITGCQKQLKFKTRRLDMDRKDAVVSSPILRATPDYTSETRPKAQKGSIIFNNDTNCLELFDGTQWKTLAVQPEG
jgi:hypothetical protein